MVGRNLFFELVTGLSLLGASAGAHAAEGDAVNLKNLSNRELEQRVKALYGAQGTSACRDMIPALAEMTDRRAFDPSYKTFKLRFDLQCALDEKRYDEAYVLLIQNEKVNGPVVGPIATVMIALEAKQYGPAVDRFIAAGTKPAEWGGLTEPFNNMRWLDGKLNDANRQDLSLSAIRRFMNTSAYRAMADHERKYIRQLLFEHEVEAGNVDAARPLLSSITTPATFFRVLADKRYAALWPDFEAKSGPNMSRLLNANVEEARAKLARNPQDIQSLAELALALDEAGRYPEVLALTDAFADAGKLATLGEHHYFALDSRVNALDGLGRGVEATALFDAMAAIPFDAKKNGWLVNFVVNRSSRLARMGEWEKVLEASARAAFVANQYGSPYARQNIAADRACALAALGKKEELESLLAKMDQNRSDDPPSAVQAMQCAGRSDRAAEIVIESLRDRDQRKDMLRNLQGPEFTVFASPTGRPDYFAPLKARAAVGALYNEVGRDLPQSLVPPAGKHWLERQALPTGR